MDRIIIPIITLPKVSTDLIKLPIVGQEKKIDKIDNTILLEDGGYMLSEDDGYIVLE